MQFNHWHHDKKYLMREEKLRRVVSRVVYFYLLLSALLLGALSIITQLSKNPPPILVTADAAAFIMVVYSGLRLPHIMNVLGAICPVCGGHSFVFGRVCLVSTKKKKENGTSTFCLRCGNCGYVYKNSRR